MFCFCQSFLLSHFPPWFHIYFCLSSPAGPYRGCSPWRVSFPSMGHQWITVFCEVLVLWNESCIDDSYSGCAYLWELLKGHSSPVVSLPQMGCRPSDVPPFALNTLFQEFIYSYIPSSVLSHVFLPFLLLCFIPNYFWTSIFMHLLPCLMLHLFF